MKAFLELAGRNSSWLIAFFIAVIAAGISARAQTPPPNDMFAASQQMEGSNWTHTGNFTFATRQPNEPHPEWANTVWFSWAAPFNGRATLWMPRTFDFQYYAAYTGSELALLQEVPLISDGGFSRCFLAIEGTIYHFQIAGGADNYTFTCRVDEFLPATNDHFVNATVLKPNTFGFVPMSVAGATMELGEPLHRSDGPQKSIWWKWQSPGHGTVSIRSDRSLIPNVVLGIYEGSSVAALSSLAKAPMKFAGLSLAGRLITSPALFRRTQSEISSTNRI